MVLAGEDCVSPPQILSISGAYCVLGAEITKQRRHGLRVSQCGGVDRHINRQQQCSVIRAMIGVAKGALGTLRRE